MNNDIEKTKELVALVEWLAWADGLVTLEESQHIILHQGLLTGRFQWDVSELPEHKRTPVLRMIAQMADGTHPAMLNPGKYKPAREGEPDPGLPKINVEFHPGTNATKETQ